MGLNPPPFFLRAIKEAPKKAGRMEGGVLPSRTSLVKEVRRMEGGVLPSRTSLVKEVRAVMRRWHPSLADGPVRSLRCWGLRPSGPPAEPLRKDLIAEKTASNEICLTAAGSTSKGGGIEESG